jgi:hypothetical protein
MVVSVLSRTAFSQMAFCPPSIRKNSSCTCFLSLLQLSVDEYIEARDGLIKKDLIAYDGTIFQVLDLPEHPIEQSSGLEEHRPAVTTLIQQSFLGR